MEVKRRMEMKDKEKEKDYKGYFVEVKIVRHVMAKNEEEARKRVIKEVGGPHWVIEVMNVEREWNDPQA